MGSLLRLGAPPVALGFTIKLVLGSEGTASDDDFADAVAAVPKPMTPKTMRKRSLSGQIRNQVNGPYNQRRKISQMMVVMRM